MALMEYQCKPFTTSSLISAFSTGILQRIVVYSKKNKTKQNKNVKPAKKGRGKQKDYILILVTFVHLQAIIVPCRRVNKLIFCTSSLTIGCKNCFINELWFCSLNCQMLITKPNTHYYIVSALQVSSVKKFIKNVNPHVVDFFFYLSFTAFFSINLRC